METGDTRYLHLNTGMWVGSGIRRGTEGGCCLLTEIQEYLKRMLTSGWGVVVIYDAYRIL